MQVKICGITQPEQGHAIAQLGATALGFICVPTSPRYIPATQIQTIVATLKRRGHLSVNTVGVFANTRLDTILEVAVHTHLTTVQLHGSESPDFCQRLKQQQPQLSLTKAFRIRTAADLDRIASYDGAVDAYLLDAYHPTQLGGTGCSLDWNTLQDLHPRHPWFLAGGLTPDNILDALSRLRPDGIDLSSGVETAPGIKDLSAVADLFHQLSQLTPSS
ncbi:N-(5'-phosphoribosyl)anthranilate isomerase [Halomicronema hongdechloris C2206]|uniref:N-(5'-phosphoribosyl)anthranilate isomerase n=1 Tax=Halomicronema hongdechloris C2206 TaxID=1641165 RepID=A0A1Z3HR75_9CYAN|nr:phosphoribosylanthranilate isomerase [Halomicronema hongdechloris]ASC72785.1 N-(5'-phosphoribosyl)anthranilate isomerase [Halomicronema hongdechloris C2206]